MNSNIRNGARNALNMGTLPTMQEADEAIFGMPGGSLANLDEGRIVAKSTPIDLIWADVKQPRRAIPISIRMHWDGNPASVPDLLRQWHQVAEESAGAALDVDALLNGEGEGVDSDKFPSVAQEFMALVRLAQGIKADGLINPITVIESDGKLLIESGERRWLAYHLLHTYLGEQWAKIPAAKGNGNDSVWRQATENTQRRQLNAIGMARQISLLIMAARGEESYHPYEEIVKAGISDRRFYAQIADGVAHPTPRGMGERIQSAMGLGKDQLSQYRALLRLTDDEQINDALWTRADVENWPESVIREFGRLTIVSLRSVIERSTWTIDDLKALKEAPRTAFDYPATPAAQTVVPRRPVTSEWMGKTVITKGNQFCRVIGVDGDWITVILPNNMRKSFHYNELTFASDRPGAAPSVPAPQPQRSPSVPGFEHDFRIGDRVRTRTGSDGEVIGLSGRLVTVRTINGSNVHDHTLLTKIAAESKFVLGDNVRTTTGRTGGIVQGFNGDTVLVKFPGGEPFSIRETMLMLEDYTPEVDESDIEEDVDPDAPQKPREWREGWTDVEPHDGPVIGSDKADSVQSKQIVPSGTDERILLGAVTAFAIAKGEKQSADLIVELSQLTDVQAMSLYDAQALKPKLDDAHDIVMAYFASIWQRMLDAAVN